VLGNMHGIGAMHAITVHVDLRTGDRSRVAALDDDPRFAALASQLVRMRAGAATLGRFFVGVAADPADELRLALRFEVEDDEERALADELVRILVLECWQEIDEARQTNSWH
jgi:hypothetical protein